MASFLQWFLDPKKNWLAAQHMKSLSQRLRKYGFFLLSLSLSFVPISATLIVPISENRFSFFKLGLRYDDLYDPYYDLDVKEALNRLPKEVVDARHARLKRAIDLSMKHQYLPDDLQVFPLLNFRLFYC